MAAPHRAGSGDTESGFPIASLVRYALLAFPLASFLYYAWKDNSFHFKGRKVTRGEHLLHLVLGITLIGLISAAFRVDHLRLTIFGGIFALAAAADEFGYHKNLPAEEIDLHAKEHISLPLFLLAAWITA